MKIKAYILQIALAAVGAGFLGSCEDMLTPESVYVLDADKNHLVSPSDTANSLVGIIYKMQAIGDRTNLLGEVRSDLVTLRTSAPKDLHELANFEITDNNKYNSPKDYYAIINNCNYYLANADKNAVDIGGNRIFEKEMAQVRSIRAWTYLQLALNYGRVPFYTNPILTEQDANRVLESGETKDLVGICDYFINDLKPYVNVDFPQLHKVGSIFMGQCFFPIDMVLGDLYLWKASIEGNQMLYREAARSYMKWISTNQNLGDGNTKSRYYLPRTSISWKKMTGSGLGSNLAMYSYSSGEYSTPSGYGGEVFTIIPMDSASSQGYFSEVRGFYNSPNYSINSSNQDTELSFDRTRDFCITPSKRIQEVSKAQEYYFINSSNGRHEELVLDEAWEDYEGDLRLPTIWNSAIRNVTENGVASTKMFQSISKTNSRNISVYKKTEVWLRLAEALNNGGFPRMAYAILATGFSKEVIEDSIYTYCNESDKAWLEALITENASGDYSLKSFHCRNGIITEQSSSSDLGTYYGYGIRSRGCGYAEKNPNYAYPMVDTLNVDGTLVDGYDPTNENRRPDWAYQHMTKEQAAVDSMIIQEAMFETCFEGKRFYDLIRFAKRYHNPEWVAGNVSKRAGEENQDGALYSKLLDESNWYLSWGGKIGLK